MSITDAPQRPKNAFGLRTEPGWMGAFTRDSFPDAIPNGTRIVKIVTEPGDSHKNDAEGVVLGSMEAGGMTGYFVEWDDGPKIACFVSGFKIEEK